MSNWRADSSRKISRRFVIEGELVLDTPASFSSGETNATEIVILEDERARLPLIPGASLAGALRHYLVTRELGFRHPDERPDGQKTLATLLFGEALDDGSTRTESRVIAHDALGEGKLTRREGVKIAGKTRTADDGMLFSTQVWETNTRFKLRFELVLFKEDTDDFIAGFAGALNALGRGEISLGGRKQRGYGRVHIENWHVSFYDMSSAVAVGAWLQNRRMSNMMQDFFALGDNLIDRRQFIHVAALVQIQDSILIRTASDVADNEHLTSNTRPILSGTSVTGALRARALKIANTVFADYSRAEHIVNDMFGHHGTEGNQNLTASRLTVEEHPIENGRFQYIQNRIKIDRFTGGAFETALFSERPLFADNSTVVQVNLMLRYPANTYEQEILKAQTGLLLLVLKDLWTEDLPLGGEASIGRGRLKGLQATIAFKYADHDRPFVVELDEAGLVDASLAGDMQTYVQALWNYGGQPV